MPESPEFRLTARLTAAAILTAATVMVGCAKSGKDERSTPVSVSPTAVGSTLTPGMLSFWDHESPLILVRSSASESELDKFDAETVLRQIFKPGFLTKENLGGDLQFRLIAATETITRGDDRIRVWEIVDNPGSKLEARIEAKYGIIGLQTAEVIGRVKKTFFHESPFVFVKPGEAHKAVEELEGKGVFNLGDSPLRVALMPDRTMADTGEKGDLVLGISKTGKTTDGRPTDLSVSFNGAFRYSISAFQPK